MKDLKKIIKNYQEKELEIEIDGEIESCSIIVWEEIVEDHNEWTRKMEGMTEQQINDYCNHSVSDFVNIFEYFLFDEEFEQKVDENKWIPFAVLGMYKPHIHGYAEMNNQGMLLFNIEEDLNTPSIVRILDDEHQTIAQNFNTLKISTVTDSK